MTHLFAACGAEPAWAGKLGTVQCRGGGRVEGSGMKQGKVMAGAGRGGTEVYLGSCGGGNSHGCHFPRAVFAWCPPYNMSEPAKGAFSPCHWSESLRMVGGGANDQAGQWTSWCDDIVTSWRCVACQGHGFRPGMPLGWCRVGQGRSGLGIARIGILVHPVSYLPTWARSTNMDLLCICKESQPKQACSPTPTPTPHFAGLEFANLEKGNDVVFH